MRRYILALLLACASLAFGAKAPGSYGRVYSNIDHNTTLDPGGSSYGWGWCGDPGCAGGNSVASQRMNQRVEGSLDGGSREFVVTGSAWADGLWWYKLGPNPHGTNFQFDFWLKVGPDAPTFSHALEFDFFQFVNPTRYMFGTECNYTRGYNRGTWDVWNDSTGRWYNTGAPCPAFVPGHWYRLTWFFNRTRDGNEHYSKVTVRHYDGTGRRQLNAFTTPLNLTLPSGRLPRGWNNTMGVQFQLDINGVPGNSRRATYSAIVDKVSLSAW